MTLFKENGDSKNNGYGKGILLAEGSDKKSEGSRGAALITPAFIGVMVLTLIFVAYFYFIFGDLVFQFTGTSGSANYPGVSVFFPFLVALLVLNPLSRLITRKCLFNEKQLLLIYLCSAAASAAMYTVIMWVLFVMGLGKYALEKPQYFAKIYDDFSGLIIPKGEEVLFTFWQGGGSVPWGAWIGPVLLWTIFIGVYGFVGICVSSIVRRRWEEGERLTYPTVYPILEMVRQGEEERILGPLWKDRLMWIGAGITGLYVFYEFLVRNFFQGAPILDREFISKSTASLFQGNPYISVAFKTWVVRWGFLSIGLLYFVDTSILFGWWFFLVVNRLSYYFFSTSNSGLWQLIQSAPNKIYADPRNWGEAKASGGFIIFFLMSLWVMRGELKEILRGAFGRRMREGELDDTKEGMPYRVAVLGMLFGFLFLILFARFALGVSLIMGILYFLLFYMQVAAVAKTRMESGLISTELIFIPGRDILLPTLGPSLLGGSRSIAGLAMMGGSAFYLGIPTSAPLISLEGWKMAGTFGFSRKAVTKVIIATLLLCFIGTLFLALPYYYNYGANMTRSATISSWVWVRAYAQVEYAETGRYAGATFATLIPQLIGALITGILYYLRTNFIWWPIHPVGYLLGTKWGYAYPTAGSAFIVWLAKVIMFRWAGPAVYRKAIPLFIGIILGETGMLTVTSILNYFIK